LRPQDFGGELRSDFDAGNRRVFRYVADLIYLDAGLAAERRLQLFGKCGRLCVAAGKRAHKLRQLRLGQGWRKMNAGDAGGSEKLGEAFLARGRAQRNTVEQNLIA
jgi:hypothetical protein